MRQQCETLDQQALRLREPPGARCGVVTDLVLLGLGIALQPFRLSAFILILSTKDGTRKGLGFILGWLACLVLVIATVLLITHARPLRFRSVPGTAVWIAKLALGIALIVLAAVESRRKGRPRSMTAVLARLDTMSPWTAALIAAIVQPWTLVAAGAVTATQARLSSVGDDLALAAFCLLATSSFVALELWSVLAPTSASARLATLRAWLDKHGKQVIVIVCLALGFWLAGQSIHVLAFGGRTAHHGGNATSAAADRPVGWHWVIGPAAGRVFASPAALSWRR
jgi:Sap-like sulfolipid-1-addressing protein